MVVTAMVLVLAIAGIAATVIQVVTVEAPVPPVVVVAVMEIRMGSFLILHWNKNSSQIKALVTEGFPF